MQILLIDIIQYLKILKARIQCNTIKFLGLSRCLYLKRVNRGTLIPARGARTLVVVIDEIR